MSDKNKYFTIVKLIAANRKPRSCKYFVYSASLYKTFIAYFPVIGLIKNSS